jgi:hypothetical protein
MLAEMRAKSLLARSLKAAVRRNCHDCRAFAEKMLASWAVAMGKQDASPLSEADCRVLL